MSRTHDSDFGRGRPPSDGPTRRGLPRRPRRPDDGRFLPKDAAAWRRLIVKARQAARNPRQFADGVGAAATRCAKAVPPPGYAHRESCFLRLLLKGMAVWQSTGEARVAHAAELEALADQCAAVLDGDGSRERRSRADIDG